MHKLKQIKYSIIIPTYELDARALNEALIQAKHNIVMSVADYVVEAAVERTDPIGHVSTMVEADFYLVTPDDLEAYVQRRINARIIDISTNRIRGRNASYAILDDNIGD